TDHAETRIFPAQVGSFLHARPRPSCTSCRCQAWRRARSLADRSDTGSTRERVAVPHRGRIARRLTKRLTSAGVMPLLSATMRAFQRKPAPAPRPAIGRFVGVALLAAGGVGGGC